MPNKRLQVPFPGSLHVTSRRLCFAFEDRGLAPIKLPGKAIKGAAKAAADAAQGGCGLEGRSREHGRRESTALPLRALANAAGNSRCELLLLAILHLHSLAEKIGMFPTSAMPPTSPPPLLLACRQRLLQARFTSWWCRWPHSGCLVAVAPAPACPSSAAAGLPERLELALEGKGQSLVLGGFALGAMELDSALALVEHLAEDCAT